MSAEFTVAAYLSSEFEHVANSLLERATGGSTQDLGSSGQETARYDKLMKSLRLVGISDAPIIFRTVWQWRTKSLERHGSGYNRQNKKVVIESTFLEASVQLLEDRSYSCEAVLGNCIAEMEQIVFHWAMFVDQIQTRTGMSQFRRNIQNAAPRIIGALARGRLEAVSAILFKEISWRERADIAVRPELHSLCDSMKCIRLSFETENLFAASLNLIQHADPMKHNAPVKKSQVRHSLCSMMSAWLQPLVDAGRIDMSPVSPGLRKQWNETIDKMQERLLAWAEQKNKHYADGFPLIVNLWCLQETRSFVDHGDRVIKMLKKALKAKDCRGLAVRLLTQCSKVALTRIGHSKQTHERFRLDDWLAKSVTEVITTLKKGPTPSAELHDLMVRMCVTIGRHRPLFVADNMIIPLIQTEQMDKTTIALRSILELMFIAVAQRSAPSSDNFSSLRSTMVSLETNSLELQLLEFIRDGNDALTLLRLEDRRNLFSREIAKLLRGFESSFGIGVPIYRSSISDNVKDSPIGLNGMAWTVRTIPYILPLEWPNNKLVDTLARYTGHADGLISSVSFRSLKNVLVGMPRTRNAVVHGLAQCILNIPDENKNGVLDGLRNLQILLLDWLSLATDATEETPPSASNFTAESLEGAMLCFLCSVDFPVRRLAFDILGHIRRLHRELTRLQDGRDSLGNEVSMSGIPFQAAALADPSIPHCQEIHRLNILGHIVSENPFMLSMYVMDVLEEMGTDIAHRVYWDIGKWSDLFRRWKSVPENITLADILLSKTEGTHGFVRLARCLSEIAAVSHSLCSKAFEHAYVLITKKLAHFSRSDHVARMSSISDMTESISLDLLRNYCCFASSCPPYKNTGIVCSASTFTHPVCLQERISRGVLSAVKLHQLLLNLLTIGTHAHQEIAVLALGNCNPEAYESLATELQIITTQEQVKEKSRGKQSNKSKMEEIRLNSANIFRIVCDQMPRGTLRFREGLRQRLLDFIDNTLNFIRHLGPGSLFESISQQSVECTPHDALQLCFCLCSVASNAGPELISASVAHSIVPGQNGLNVELRRVFFQTLQQWNSPGLESGSYAREKNAMRSAVLAKYKLTDSYAHEEAELDKACRYLEVASRLAMVALLQGPSWEADRDTNNPILNWVDYLLMQAEPRNLIGPSNVSIARQALTKLIISNTSLFDSYVNKCYKGNQGAASVYFQVVCEVYCSYEVNIAVHVILSLVLYKCVDENAKVREDALHLLKCLSHREWEGKCTTGWALWSNGNSIEDDVIVIGSLQDTCQSFQYTLSESLAREHPEVRDKLCEELMTRQCSEVVNQGVLLSLTPWMEQLSFSPGDSDWGDRLLKSMYYVTVIHGKEFSHELERLWSTIASKGNVRPILNFLVGIAVKECALQDAELLLEYFSVLKRISLYLARSCPHRTIDHLVSEAARMMSAPAVVSIGGEQDSGTDPLKFSSASNSSATLPRRHDGSASSQMEMTRSAEASTGSGARHRPPSFTMTSMHHRDHTYASNVSVSMQSDGSYEEVFKSDAQLVPTSKTSISNLSALGGERRGSEVVAPMLKGLLQRADVAICMLAEIAYEKGDAFSDHVPLLFHLCVVCMDSLEPVVRFHCQQLVINLLNVLLAKRVGVPGKANKLSALVSALQSMKGQPPWPYEDTKLSEGQVLSESTVNFFVAGLLEATSDGSNLKDLWMREALTWAVECSSRHLSCRSFQVLRGLAPTASSEAFISLVRCLKACFIEPTLTAMECVLEILETMKLLMMNAAEASKLVLYPQLFWVCIALLTSDYVHIYRLALELLYCLLDSLKISNDIILNVLLATTPTSVKYSPVLSSSMGIIREEESANKAETKEIQHWDLGTQILLPFPSGRGRPVLCIQHLLIKGLHLAQTETVTTKLLSLLASELILSPEVTLDSSSYVDDFRPKTGEHSGVAVLLGSVNVQLGVSLASVVPWTCQKILAQTSMDGPWEVCRSLADACISRYNTVGMALVDLTNAESRTLPLALRRLSDAMCEELPSQVLSLIIGYWLGYLRNKEHGCAQISLMLLRSVFERCKSPNSTELPNLQALRVVSDFNVFSLISSHLQGSNSIEATEVLSAMVACSALSHQPETIDQEQNAILSQAMDMGMELHQLVPSDQEHIKMTVNGVLETCPQHLKKPSGKEFMPFLREQQD